jgi:hypothetical protein
MRYSLPFSMSKMSEHFQTIVNKETVESFGIDMSLWGEEEQRLLHEGMILAMKENPDWTEEEVRVECENQVDNILFEWFQVNLARSVKKSQGWRNLGQAYAEFRKTTLKNFLTLLNEKQKFQHFCEEFYDDLREMWNICSAGMEDEYERMKEKGWTMAEYRRWLDKEMRKSR